MLYIKYYMKDLNTYFKQFKVSIKTFIIVEGRDNRYIKNKFGILQESKVGYDSLNVCLNEQK